MVEPSLESELELRSALTSCDSWS